MDKENISVIEESNQFEYKRISKEKYEQCSDRDDW